MCMHPSAQYLDHTDSNSDRGRLYGMEYQYPGSIQGPFQQASNREVQNEENCFLSCRLSL